MSFNTRREKNLESDLPIRNAGFAGIANGTKVEAPYFWNAIRMTQSYAQIKKQIETLQRQADKLRQREIGEVIDRIKVAIQHYELSAEQLGFGAAAGVAKAKAGRQKKVSTSSAKYSDGQGNSWSGMGKRPGWLRTALDAGRTLEEFTNGQAAPAPAPKAVKSKTSKKRKAKISYRDDAGHTWSGMGPRPRWLKEALDAGKTLEQMMA